MVKPGIFVFENNMTHPTIILYLYKDGGPVNAARCCARMLDALHGVNPGAAGGLPTAFIRGNLEVEFAAHRIEPGEINFRYVLKEDRGGISIQVYQHTAGTAHLVFDGLMQEFFEAYCPELTPHYLPFQSSLWRFENLEGRCRKEVARALLAWLCGKPRPMTRLCDALDETMLERMDPMILDVLARLRTLQRQFDDSQHSGQLLHSKAAQIAGVPVELVVITELLKRNFGQLPNGLVGLLKKMDRPFFDSEAVADVEARALLLNMTAELNKALRALDKALEQRPNPNALSDRLTAGESVDVYGYRLALQGEVLWYTNPSGVDGILGGGETTAEKVRFLIERVEQGGSFGPDMKHV